MTRRVESQDHVFESPFVVLDGGLSTELERLGVVCDSELWTAGAVVTDPDAVVDAHAAFAGAGARVLISASYQAGVDELERACGDRRSARRLLAKTTRLARDGYERAGLPAGRVAASLGPYGALRADGSEYSGRYEAPWSEVRRVQRERLAVLAESEPDWIAIETVPTRVEADLVLEELLGHPEATAWVSFTCRDSESTWGGDPIDEAIALAASSPQVVAVGVNCTAPQHVTELLQRAAEVTRLPLVVYANRGGTWDATSGTWSESSTNVPVDWERLVPGWVAAGARLIGGCCGVGSDEIGRLAGLRAELAVDPDFRSG
jgi:homocysteine S-methyltransferase